MINAKNQEKGEETGAAIELILTSELSHFYQRGKHVKRAGIIIVHLKK